jgi:beta-N-acetylhexosaminidase
MEGRIPPDDDELFEWTDAPARLPREPESGDTSERERGTGERDRPGTGERDRLGTGERGRIPSEPESTETGERDPLATGERRRPVRRGVRWRRRTRSDTEEQRRVQRDPRVYEREGRSSPPGRRSRHRDLPARVRRRQAIGASLVGLLVIVVLVIAISGGGGGGSEAPVGLKRLLGQTIVATTKGGVDKPLVTRARKGEIGGVIVVPKNAQTLRKDVRRLQEAASSGHNPPLLVMIDQEGGGVKRLKDGPPDSSPPQLGQAGDEDAAKDEGQNTGSYLKGLGVNVDLAPVLDVKHPQTADTIAARTYGSDTAVVSKIGVAFIEGLQDGGVLATAKHFPGLGAATVNTDDRPVAVAATRQDLESGLEPFRDAVDAGVGMVMVSTASYPTLGSKKQAAFSPAIVQGLLRDDLGFDGVVITDDLESGAVASVTTPGLAAQNALKAGDDLLLYATNNDASEKAFGSLISQVKRGELQRDPVEDAYDRIASLKDDLP